MSETAASKARRNSGSGPSCASVDGPGRPVIVSKTASCTSFLIAFLLSVDVRCKHPQQASAAGGLAIDLTQGQTIIRYSDENQSVLFDSSVKFSVIPLGNADNDFLLEPGEMYELVLLSMETNLTTNLVKSKTFILEVMTPKGAVLHIERTTPVGVEKYNDLG